MRSALASAETRGTSAFTSSWDTGGLECKGEGTNQDHFGPPTEDDIGVSTLAAQPEMTDVGGTSGQTIVFFEIDGYDPTDLSSYAKQFTLPVVPSGPALYLVIN
jgi:hypothetical protein